MHIRYKRSNDSDFPRSSVNSCIIYFDITPQNQYICVLFIQCQSPASNIAQYISSTSCFLMNTEVKGKHYSLNVNKATYISMSTNETEAGVLMYALTNVEIKLEKKSMFVISGQLIEQVRVSVRLCVESATGRFPGTWPRLSQ